MSSAVDIPALIKKKSSDALLAVCNAYCPSLKHRASYSVPNTAKSRVILMSGVVSHEFGGGENETGVSSAPPNFSCKMYEYLVVQPLNVTAPVVWANPIALFVPAMFCAINPSISALHATAAAAFVDVISVRMARGAITVTTVFTKWIFLTVAFGRMISIGFTKVPGPRITLKS